MDIQVDAKKVIVFDLDDTLYNEMEYLRSAYMEIAKKVDSTNWHQLFAKMFSLFRSKKDVFEFVSQNYKIDKLALLNSYRTHVPQIHLFDGVLDVMTAIKVRHGKIGIITDGRTNTQRAKLKALNILQHIDKIIISEEIGSEKPNEGNYQAIEDTFTDCSYLYIADNLRKDFIAPNRMGWKTIGLIDNGLNMHFDAFAYFDKKRLPQEFVASFEEINII